MYILYVQALTVDFQNFTVVASAMDAERVSPTSGMVLQPQKEYIYIYISFKLL